MRCAEVDLKGYAFGEGSRQERADAESHVKSCDSCREELGRLQFTQAALGALREEEVPRRIAFVSDKVFEPTWWQRLWNSGPKLGFASAGLLSAAILAHAFVGGPLVTATQGYLVYNDGVAAAQPPSQPAPAVIPVSDSEIQKRIDDAVLRAVADVEKRQSNKTALVLAAAEKRYEMDRIGLRAAYAENWEIQTKQFQQAMKQVAGLRAD